MINSLAIDNRQLTIDNSLLLLGSFIGYIGLLWVNWRFGTLRDEFVVWTIGFYLLAFGCFVGLVWLNERRTGLPLRWLWGAAILFRVLLLFSTPTLSDDVYRYIWDGHLATQGVSPYAHPVESPVLDQYDIPQRAQVNNAWMASPYLPVAQWLFAAVAFLFPLSPLPFQVVMVVVDLGTAVLLTKLLSLANIPQRRVLLYLLNPLVIVEVAHGAHVDAWMNFLLVGALWLGVRCQVSGVRWCWDAGAVVLGLATLTKILPGAAAVVLFWRWSWRQRVIYGAVTLGLLLPAALRAGWGLTGDLDGSGLFGAVRIYARYWMFNGALPRGTVPFVDEIAAVFGVTVILWVWWRARAVQSVVGVVRGTAVLLITYLILTPTFHPWYALIVTVLLPFLTPTRAEKLPQQWLLVAAWLYLNGALILSYLTYRDPLNFAELSWVRVVAWWPTLLLIGAYLVRMGRYLSNNGRFRTSS